MTSTLVYSRTNSGHKDSYARLFARLFDADVMHRFERSRASVVGPLLRADRVLFLTLDDDIPTFAAVSLLRWIRGRSTAGLYLRPQSCFEPGVAPLLKRLFFTAIRATGLAKVFVIVPFDAAPHYAKVATGWVYDPEMWDVDLLRGPGPLLETELVRDICAQAEERPVVFLLGDFLDRKGGGFLTGLLETAPDLAASILFVAAGRVGKGAEGLAVRFARAGGWVVGRRISDEELFSFYGRGTAAWSCYSAVYDQASGIFGRAVQTGCPAIVRRGSRLERMAADLGHPVIALGFDPTPETAKILATEVSALPRRDEAATVDITANRTRRADFMKKINNAM